MKPSLANARFNLLPVSVSDDFQLALCEWHFTGRVIDYPPGSGWIICELSERPQLSEHFEIANPHTDAKLLVGASALINFPEIEVRDRAGIALTDPASRKARLREALHTTVRERALQPLRTALKRAPECRAEIERTEKAIEQHGRVDPKDLLCAFERFRAAGIRFNPWHYKVNLRSAQAARQLREMSASERQRIKPALTPEQIKRHAHLYSEGAVPFSG